MASIGHVLVGAAAAKAYRAGQTARWPAIGAALAWSALSLLPDADIAGFALGVRYADPWGHRGATHSFVFALAIGALAGLIARAAKLPAWRTALVAAAVVASHPLLDTLTDGGLGCALLWPFSDERFFAPWRPIPVAPIGPKFLSARGLRIVVTEMVLLAPFLLYALWPRSRPARR
jgi:inner membrane protein